MKKDKPKKYMVTDFSPSKIQQASHIHTAKQIGKNSILIDRISSQSNPSTATRLLKTIPYVSFKKRLVSCAKQNDAEKQCPEELRATGSPAAARLAVLKGSACFSVVTTAPSRRVLTLFVA